MKTRYHITFSIPEDKNPFLSGTNIEQDNDDIIKAIETFKEKFPTAKIKGILLSDN